MTSQMTADGSKPRDPREINGGLGLTRALQDTPRLGPQRKHVARAGRGRRRGSPGPERLRTVAARSAAEIPVVTPAPRFDRDRERRPEIGRVLAHHERKLQLVTALFGQSQTDQAAAMPRHEVDRFGSHLLGGQDEVALVLAVLVVHDDHETARLELLDGAVDIRKNGQ